MGEGGEPQVGIAKYGFVGHGRDLEAVAWKLGIATLKVLDAPGRIWPATPANIDSELEANYFALKSGASPGCITGE